MIYMINMIYMFYMIYLMFMITLIYRKLEMHRWSAYTEVPVARLKIKAETPQRGVYTKICRQ